MCGDHFYVRALREIHNYVMAGKVIVYSPSISPGRFFNSTLLYTFMKY